MSAYQIITAEDFKDFTIPVYEPFSDFLLGTTEEKSYEISLLDVVRFAGHACPSIIGAFLTTKKAVEELYPETKVCIRGRIKIDLPGTPSQGATGPISNVFGFITGAWGETGFGGIKGRFNRRGLLRFGVSDVPMGGVRFTRIIDNSSVIVHYDPSRIPIDLNHQEEFQLQWRRKIRAILSNPELAIWSKKEAS